MILGGLRPQIHSHAYIQTHAYLYESCLRHGKIRMICGCSNVYACPSKATIIQRVYTAKRSTERFEILYVMYIRSTLCVWCVSFGIHCEAATLSQHFPLLIHASCMRDFVTITAFSFGSCIYYYFVNIIFGEPISNFDRIRKKNTAKCAANTGIK